MNNLEAASLHVRIVGLILWKLKHLVNTKIAPILQLGLTSVEIITCKFAATKEFHELIPAFKH